MPEHDAAIQLNLARSRQEVKRQNIKQNRVTFQNKTLRVDTSTRREASCLPYCTVADSNRIGAATQQTISSGNWKLLPTAGRGERK